MKGTISCGFQRRTCLLWLRGVSYMIWTSFLLLRSICTVFETIFFFLVWGLRCAISSLAPLPAPYEMPLTNADCPKLKVINASDVAIFTPPAETFLPSFVLTKTHLSVRTKLYFGLTTVQCAHPCKLQAPWACDSNVIPKLKRLTEHGFLFT